MADPSLMTTVTIGEYRFNALATHFGFSTLHDHTGLPVMGSLQCDISVTINMHDNKNVPFETLQGLFELAHMVTSDKISNIKIEYWVDEGREDAVCTYSFRGWISSWNTSSGGGSNHILTIGLQPALSKNQFVEFKMGN